MLNPLLTWIDGQAFASHEHMECVYRGMYRNAVDDGSVFEASVILQNLTAFAPLALSQCPISAAVNLTNTATNQKSYIGQISCCVAVGATIATTTKAWWSLAECQREDANEQARGVIEQWKNQNLRHANCLQQNGQLEFPF
jgi:hypothetical protein